MLTDRSAEISITYTVLYKNYVDSVKQSDYGDQCLNKVYYNYYYLLQQAGFEQSEHVDGLERLEGDGNKERVAQ